MTDVENQIADRAAAVARMVMTWQVNVTEHKAGRTVEDILPLLVDDLQQLWADGPADALVTLLALVDELLGSLARARGLTRTEATCSALNLWLSLHAPDATPFGAHLPGRRA